MIQLDGAMGEGGGQILRSALALSLVTGLPFRIRNLRARRTRPGLRPQHLTALRAAAAVGGAAVEGAALGSQVVTFRPGPVRPGEYRFAIGTAGSTTLVLQTVLPALLTARGPSTLVLEGGTHNPLAPPFDFLAATYLPLLRRMGPRVEATLVRPGFVPSGGGEIRVTVRPAPRLTPLTLTARGAVRRTSGVIYLARLPEHVARREVERLRRRLGWPPEAFAVRPVRAAGPGNCVVLTVASEALTETFTAVGERGIPAETVADRAAGQVERYLRAGVPVGEHLADQLLLPLALAGGGTFVTLPQTAHTRTHAEVIHRFLPVRIRLAGEGERWRVTVTGVD